MERYIVRYKRDVCAAWIATVSAFPGCHTYRRTLDQARKRIREALAVFDTAAAKAELIDRVVLVAPARALLTRVKTARIRAASEQIEGVDVDDRSGPVPDHRPGIEHTRRGPATGTVSPTDSATGWAGLIPTRRHVAVLSCRGETSPLARP